MLREHTVPETWWWEGLSHRTCSLDNFMMRFISEFDYILFLTLSCRSAWERVPKRSTT